ncbi:probable delta 8-sphingolipid desaturase [Cephalotrichum gorgonifer]|uniref:Delta 8-(E)-sphingolipid desaturase n=1 Tax=Cephalotrichum gorgonifer TaxID=2041049 RepID=A0AAE8MX55_9PEZI|nr:probable delta 8-sphingolipid desaturase [Cephalotrichum gorgonifer]
MGSNSATAPSKRAYPILSREDIAQLIAKGSKVIIVDQHVLKVDPWIKYHPGGDLAILHMVGRDATDEVNALHSPEARRQMDRYRIGRIEGRWRNFVPPIQGGISTPVRSQEEPKPVPAACPEASKDSGSSGPSSRASSPVFDTDASTLRNRRGGDISSSASSTYEEEDVGAMDGITYLDALTKEEVRLDFDKYPSLDLDSQNFIVEKYRQLHERVRAEGYYNCNYKAYGIEASRYLTFILLSLLFLRLEYYAISGMFLGFFWHQASFCVHDAGHMGITHNFTVDTLIGMFLSNFCGGLSLGWWKWSHNVHHIVTNSPEHDPDNQHLPFLAVNHRFFRSLYSTYHHKVMKYDLAAQYITSIQAWLYYPIMCAARFNLYLQSWIYLLSGTGPKRGPAWWHRWLELVGMAFFWTWFGYFLLYKTIPTNRDRLVFFLVSNLTTVPLHIQITLSHFAMSTTDMGPQESFAQKMLRTTMDVDCPQWLDFFHGGLQFQAIHHLFPRVPRHNLRALQGPVREFCADVGIPYALYGFVDGNKYMLGHLAEVSRQGAILAKCQRTVARRGDYLHDVFSG